MRLDFANPGFLWLKPLIPLLIWWWVCQRRNALRHPTVGVLAGLPTGHARFARGAGAVLRGLALFLVLLALAGPRLPDLRTRLDTEGVAIAMVVDVSASMIQEPHFVWSGEEITRLETAKRAFTLFVVGGEGDGVKFEGRPSDLVGFVAFATYAEKVFPPTMDHAVVLDLLQRQGIARAGDADTFMSDALVVALARLKAAPPKRKALVLLTDGLYSTGQSNTYSGWTPEQVASIAAELGVHVYIIDVYPRTGEETPDRVRSIKTMQTMATTTSGSYFPVDDIKGLLEAYQAIDRMEHDDISTWHYRRYIEAYPWCGAAAFLVLLLTAALESTVWRRLP